jgi:hypothetical protein
MRWGLALAVIVATASGAAAEHKADLATALTDPKRLPLRVHVAKVGAFGLTADAPLVANELDRDGASYDDVPLIETGRKRVRIVHDEDEARMFLWIAERDLGWALTTRTRIAGKGDVGIWLLPGARVTATGTGARRRVKTRLFYTGVDVELTGVVPTGALARTFAPTPDVPAPASPRRAASVRATPDGKKLASFPEGVTVQVVSDGSAGWKLVEHRSRWLEVRGWTHERELTEDPSEIGSAFGGGYGMPTSRRVEVNAGACLYASKDGPIVGVELAARTRYVDVTDGTWWTVYVGNAWGVFTVHARAASVVKGKPTFAPCP